MSRKPSSAQAYLHLSGSPKETWVSWEPPGGTEPMAEDEQTFPEHSSQVKPSKQLATTRHLNSGMAVPNEKLTQGIKVPSALNKSE